MSKINAEFADKFLLNLTTEKIKNLKKSISYPNICSIYCITRPHLKRNLSCSQINNMQK